MVETIQLSGQALCGVESSALDFSDVPETVRLGRVRPTTPVKMPALSAYHSLAAMAASPPVSTNRRDKASPALARMYKNDVEGCCVIAGKMHSLGVWSANDSDSGGVVQATDSEVHAQYQSICGPGDQGCVITHVLDVMRTKGLTAGGKAYKIDGYVKVDWRNKVEVQVALYLFGTLTIGINLPDEWTRAAVWDITTSKIVGGHDVSLIDYGPGGVYLSSWGRVYLMTWAALADSRWVEECYAILAPSWYGNDQLAPCGVDVATLKADLAKLGAGEIPPLPDGPVTPPPVTPPPVNPPLFSVTVNRAIPRGGNVAFKAGVPIPAGRYDWVPSVAKDVVVE